jgi:hypothetical protein
VIGVAEGSGVIDAVAVAVAGMLVGTGDSVTMNVEVGDGVKVGVVKVGIMVMAGVLVGTFGTHSN